MNSILLKGSGLRKVYKDFSESLEAVSGVDVYIKKGEWLSVTGPSGAGKSTLLHMLGGLDRPTQGRVEFKGDDLYGLSEGRQARIRNTCFGFVFQFYHLLPELNALENVMLPFMIKSKLIPRTIRQNAEALLDRFGLSSRMSHLPGQLSGGEQQRAAIARALITEPELIFCDEPTGNLDSENGKQVWDILKELNDQGTTLVVVTHEEDIAKKSHRSYHILDGKMQENLVS